MTDIDQEVNDVDQGMTDVERVTGMRLPDVDLGLRMTDFDLTVTDVDEH